jgi:four helix bundle protein
MKAKRRFQGRTLQLPIYLVRILLTEKEDLMKVRNYQELIVWQRAMDLVEQVYSISKSFPREEMYGLTSQLRRAAVSIPSNIAEGQGRRTTADFVRHLSISYGSLREVETQILIAARLQYLSTEGCRGILEMAGEVGRLLNGLMSSLAG